jgi:nucleoside-diphosphate kinase
MNIERTLCIIKPDATERNITGVINSRIEESDLRIIAQRRIKLSQEQAREFYNAHKERSFFPDLCNFMTSGPVVVQALEGKKAIAHFRKIIGATNPANADKGTIRRDFAESIERNSIHGSDSMENAAREINFFFGEVDIVG